MNTTQYYHHYRADNRGEGRGRAERPRRRGEEGSRETNTHDRQGEPVESDSGVERRSAEEVHHSIWVIRRTRRPGIPITMAPHCVESVVTADEVLEVEGSLCQKGVDQASSVAQAYQPDPASITTDGENESDVAERILHSSESEGR